MFLNLTNYLTVKDILGKVSEEDLFKRYAKDFPKEETFSPFRNEKHPSFGYHFKTGRWKWKDLSTGEHGDIFDYLARSENLPSLQDVLQFINSNLGLKAGTVQQPQYSRIITNTNDIFQNTTATHSKRQKFLQAVTRPWTQNDTDVWNKWIITPDILKFYHVGAAQQAFSNKELIWVHKPDNPLYFFHFPVSKHLKFYRPLAEKGAKFFGNCNNLQDVYGYYQCDIKVRRPRLLILTKAGKECMHFRAYHIDAMAIHGEGQYYDTDFIRHLKKYCGRIISLYDNDPAGIHGAWDLRNRYDIPAMFIPKQLKAKNITDLHEINPRAAYQVINHLQSWNHYQSVINPFRNILNRYSNTETDIFTGK